MSYQPELGQAIFGQPTEEFEIPEYAVSLMDGVIRLVGLAYWNAKQKEWGDCLPADFGPLHLRPYSWNEDEDAGPNLWHDGHPLRMRWYKHFGRGMSANMELIAKDWIGWHDAAMKAIRETDGGKWL